jgi:hypothetical protein
MRKNRILFNIFFFLLLSTTRIFGQQAAPLNDINVVIHQETLNKLVLALGEVKGNSEYDFMFMTWHYQWSVLKSVFELMPGKANFISDVKVDVGPFSYSSKVNGNVDVTYDMKTNLISVKVKEAVFELYTVIFGKKFHIKDINLADYYQTPFTFEGPMSIETEMEFTMPDNTLKKLYARPTNCILTVQDKKIVVASEIDFFDKSMYQIKK